MDVTTAPRAELVRMIFAQQDTIASLETQIAELRSRLDKQGPPLQGTPSWVKANKKTKKKTGPRKKRDENFSRKLDMPTKRVFHTHECCPDCGGALGKPAVSYTRQTIDLPPTEAEVTEHVVFKRWCFSCKKRVAPKVQLQGVVVGQQRFGIRIMSIVDMLKEVCRQPLETIQSYFEILHQLHLSKGVLVRMLHTTAGIGKPSYEGLMQQVREASVVFADETGGRENGKNGYYWSFSTPTVHFLVYDKSRKNAMVPRVLGQEGEEGSFTGVLSTDFYTAYNIYTGFHQRCWVHLSRDIKELQEKHPKHPPLNIWAKQVKNIYAEAKAWSGPEPHLSVFHKEQERIAKQQYFEEKLRSIVTPWVKKEVPMSTLSARIIKHLQELFVFVRFEGVPSDNNAAERIIRNTVVKRKISGGTRSKKGSETKAILTSLFDTWKLQNKNPLAECQLLLAACQ